MRLAISNIAWDIVEDEAVAVLLQKYQVDAIDIAPGKYFPEPENASIYDILNIKNWWGNRGIEITGMQALLFGTQGLNLFGSVQSQNLMLSHLASVCRIAAGLKATRLVFGSPRNRDCSGLNEQEVLDTAITFFRQLGDIAHVHNIVICLEPTPAHYNANFMTTTAETARIVELIQHPAIKMQFDTEAMILNQEKISDIFPKYSHLIGHIHISEVDLLPIGTGNTQHCAIHHVLEASLPEHIVTIEMLATSNEPHLHSIERALQHTVNIYRSTL